MIEKYILVDFKNQKFISLFSEDGDKYKEERIITDLSVYNLLIFKAFVIDDKENADWYIQNYSFDSLEFQAIKLSEINRLFETII